MKKFIIHRIKKLKQKNVGGALAHNLRTRVPDYVDKNRIGENLVLDGVPFGRSGYSAATEKINLMLERHQQVAGRRARSDAVLLIESFYSISPEHIKNMDRQDIMDYFRDCTNFAVRHYGAGDSNNLVSAVVHLDEKTPHLHVLTAPVVDGIFNAKKLIGGSKHILRKKQDAIYSEVGVKYDLDRGVCRELTGSKHVKNSEIQELRRLRVRPEPSPQRLEVRSNWGLKLPPAPTARDIMLGRGDAMRQDQTDVFNAVIDEYKQLASNATDLHAENNRLVKQINGLKNQIEVPIEFVRRSERQRQREAAKKFAKKLRGVQERLDLERSQVAQERARIPAQVRRATEAECERLQAEQDRLRADRQRVDREVRQARQIAEQLEDERKLLKQQRLHYAQLSAGIDAQVEERLAERQADLEARLVEAQIQEQGIQERRQALDAAENEFNERWERFQNEREQWGREVSDWDGRAERKQVDIRTREIQERVPYSDWLPDHPVAPVVERQPNPLPPRSGGGRGGRGGPNPFAINKRPRPRR